MTLETEVPLDINENFLYILNKCHSIISSHCPPPHHPTKAKILYVQVNVLKSCECSFLF